MYSLEPLSKKEVLMKIFNTLFFLALGLVLASNTAFARDSHHRGGLSLNYNNHHNDIQLGYSVNSYRHQKKQHSAHRYSYKPYSSYGYKRHNYQSKHYNNNYQYNRYNNHHSQKACHPVTKIVTDHYGRYQSIGGTMCYDNYGQGYVVTGSRYRK